MNASVGREPSWRGSSSQGSGRVSRTLGSRPRADPLLTAPSLDGEENGLSVGRDGQGYPGNLTTLYTTIAPDANKTFAPDKYIGIRRLVALERESQLRWSVRVNRRSLQPAGRRSSG